MKKVFAITMSGLAALALAISLDAPAPAAAAGDPTAALTAWRCPITGQIFTSPFTCQANCSGFTCQPVSQ